jgi:hypothetical protein
LAGATQLIKAMVKESVAYTRAAQRCNEEWLAVYSVAGGSTLMLACSIEKAPTKDSLTAQFFTLSEISQLLMHCRTLGSRLGLQTAAMVTVGIYGPRHAGRRCMA